MISTSEQLATLADHLASRREAIMRAWREAAESDSRLNVAAALSLAQFNDHIPEVLDAFENYLAARDRSERREAAEEQKEGAACHGLHRWQQGYDQRQVMREWGHLHLCLVDELESYASAHPDLAQQTMPIARRTLARLCSEGAAESAAQCVRLEQVEAASRVAVLEQALAQLRELERERAEVWREAAHDLRGNLGIVKNATVILNRDDVSDGVRARFQVMLQTGVASLHGLLDDLTSLARLEAGHEKAAIAPFDAGVLLEEMCANMQPIADERHLFLAAEGPATLEVEGDAVKVRRIIQNLLHNALKYTEHGGVKVVWGESTAVGSVARWEVYVQDTGPGLKASATMPLARVLKKATEEAQLVEEKAEETGGAAAAEPAPTVASQSTLGPARGLPGEGIGLSIVKRLCELLDASLELETAAGEGSTFRVIFPRGYNAD